MQVIYNFPSLVAAHGSSGSFCSKRFTRSFARTVSLAMRALSVFASELLVL